MHSVADALAEVLRRAQTLSTETIPVMLGRVLAEDIQADADAPSFDKSMMDGIAVRSSDATLGARFTIVDEVAAGRVSTKQVGQGQAIRIMTGAPIPAGADAVVMVEHCRFHNDFVTIEKSASAGQNLQPRGKEMRAGEVVLRAGTTLQPAQIGLLAAVGRTEVRAYRVPRVAIVSTGDELVEAGDQLGPGQIRNSNGPMLAAQLTCAGAATQYLGIARDTRDDLHRLLSLGLQHDVLILSGGVSMGTFDLVPGVLAELGVESHVHKVHMKPGKPLYFGIHGTTLVFGLPGNPISSFVGFELFVVPALKKLMGDANPNSNWMKLPLAKSVEKSDRPTYHPAKLEKSGTTEAVRPLQWQGSADLRRLCEADSLALAPAGTGSLDVGAEVEVLRLGR